jgi:membrane-associated phospholipid phosphatase
MVTRWRHPAWLAVGAVACFLVLAVLVATGTTQALDVEVVSRLRPRDAWGPAQVEWSPWMSRLQPGRMYLLLAATSAAAAAWRRSWWPPVFGAVLAGSSAALTVMAKVALDRPDPHGWVATSGGSYPSGHVVALLVCLSGCLLLVGPRVRWWLWAPVVGAAALLTVSLLVSAAHWPSDVLGGALLAVALVGGLSSLSLRQRAVAPASRKSSSRGATTAAS